jgi:hypothetical protein
VVVENGRLVFKADVISKTPEVSYLEGIWLREDVATKTRHALHVRADATLARKHEISLPAGKRNE